MRFHLDENMSPSVADGLRRRGIDVTTTQEVGLLSAPDDEQLRYALQNGRVVVTHDRDFLIAAASGASHAGIAFIRDKSRSIGQVIEYLELMATCMTDAEMLNRVEFI
jgi:predicted nuclease of predicted toxin-antitoxin system